jgi:plasmid maintenance system antidote protein VapI
MNELKFRIALLKKNISQNKLARQMGIHPQTLCNYIRGYRRIPKEIIVKISKILDIPLNFFKTNQSGGKYE